MKFQFSVLSLLILPVLVLLGLAFQDWLTYTVAGPNPPIVWGYGGMFLFHDVALDERTIYVETYKRISNTDEGPNEKGEIVYLLHEPREAGAYIWTPRFEADIQDSETKEIDKAIAVVKARKPSTNPTLMAKFDKVIEHLEDMKEIYASREAWIKQGRPAPKSGQPGVTIGRKRYLSDTNKESVD